MDQQEFKKQYLVLQKGRITRRHFMQVTGLGVASAVIAACAPAASSPTPGPTAEPTPPPAKGPRRPTIDPSTPTGRHRRAWTSARPVSDDVAELPRPERSWTASPS